MAYEAPFDQVLADGRWKFDDSVTAVFDNMLTRSIPQYEVMRSTVDSLAMHFATAQPGGCVVDIGCSRGEAIATLVDRCGSKTNFVGVEMSPPMLDTARERFTGRDNVSVLELDLRTEYPDVTAAVTLCVLTVQFIPIEHRQQLIQRIYDHTESGGALILVEKVLGSTADLDRLMVAAHLEMKRRNGYSQEQIDRKRLSLEGVLVPVTAKWNVEMLETAGFRGIDCFWRWMNFAGWVAVRP